MKQPGSSGPNRSARPKTQQQQKRKQQKQKGSKQPHQAKDGLFNNVPSEALAAALEGKPAGVRVVDLPTKLTVLKKGIVDRLSIVRDTEPYLLHVEHQSKTDSNMSERMFCYRAHILELQLKHKKLRGLPVRQHVLYCGPGRWNLDPKLELECGTYHYRYEDAKDLDPQPFLNSDESDGVIFAALCRDGDQKDVLRRVLQWAKALPEQDHLNFIATLSLWCEVRNSLPLLKSELAEMGIQFDIENSKLFREAFAEKIERVRQETAERGRQEAERVRQEAERVRQETAERGRQEAERVRQETAERGRQETLHAVVTAMKRRFKKDVPGNLRGRLEKYTGEELLDVMVRMATAASAEEALGMEPDDGSVSLAPR